MPPALELLDVVRDRKTGRGPERQAGPVSLAVQQEELVSVLGPAGCGKTTLLKMVAGVIPVSGGEIRFDGSRGRPGSHKLGISLHTPSLLPWRTALQNTLLLAELLDLDREEAANRARRLLAWFGLSNLEGVLPHALPAGVAEVISVCRALVPAPSLLLLDEPFRTLDPLVLEGVLDGFQRLWMERKSAALLFTRNMSEAVLLSDRIVVLSAGPGRVLQTFPVDLPRPRRFDRAMSPAIAEYCIRIRTVFRAQGVLP
jgi:NitT/TauT family transport system ATP-binding protein